MLNSNLAQTAGNYKILRLPSACVFWRFGSGLTTIVEPERAPSR